MIVEVVVFHGLPQTFVPNAVKHLLESNKLIMKTALVFDHSCDKKLFRRVLPSNTTPLFAVKFPSISSLNQFNTLSINLVDY